MEEKSEVNTIENVINEEKTFSRIIFLNLFINVFVIMSYFYCSEIFGSISTSYVKYTKFSIQFGFTLLLFTFFSILAGWYHGFIAGFIGELLYQLAYYDMVYIHWCFIVGIYGFICGIYKYKPLKYTNTMKIYYTFLMLIVSTIITMTMIIVLQDFFLKTQIDIETITLNYGAKFLFQALITVVFIVPILLLLYDRFLAKKERHLYYTIFTHHPISQSDHTFYLRFGRTYIYFCSRCSGVIIGGIIAMFFTHLFEKASDAQFTPELAVLLCIIFPIPGLIDWGTQRLLLRKSTTKTRLITGFIIGNALHFLSFTQKYYFFMLGVIIIYFSIFFLLFYFGYRKEMKMYNATNEVIPEQSPPSIM